MPFLLRTGKRMAASAQRVSLVLKPAEGPLHSTGNLRNVVIFDLKGNGAIEIQMAVKKPGPDPCRPELHLAGLENVADGRWRPTVPHPRRVRRRPVLVHQLGRAAAAFTTFAPLQGDQRPEVQI